jgi:hypothetical protein
LKVHFCVAIEILKTGRQNKNKINESFKTNFYGKENDHNYGLSSHHKCDNPDPGTCQHPANSLRKLLPGHDQANSDSLAFMIPKKNISIKTQKLKK